MRFFYVDESWDQDARLAGVAVLETWHPIGQQVIDFALGRLKRQSARLEGQARARVQQTLLQGTFHAQEDGGLAWEAFNEAIVQSVVGMVHLSLVRLGADAVPPRELVYRQAQTILASVLTTSSEPFEIVMEQRDGWTTQAAADWLDGLWSIFAKGLEEFAQGPPENDPRLETLRRVATAQPLRRPPGTIRVVGKDSRVPGLQVVDHILWTRMRDAKGKPEGRLFRRVCKEGIIGRFPSDSLPNPLEYFETPQFRKVWRSAGKAVR